MRRYLLFAWLVLIARAAGAAMFMLPASSGGASYPPCASGFTAVGADYCASTSASTITIGSVGGGSGSTCYQSSALTGVTTAVALNIEINYQVAAQNVIGTDNAFVRIMISPTDSTCAGGYQWGGGTEYEDPAVSPSGTELAGAITSQKVATNGEGQFYYQNFNTTGGSGVNLWLVGYYQ